MPRHIEISIPCFDLIDKCLKSNPKQRISHTDLLEHAFFKRSEDELSRLILTPNTDAAFDPPMTISQLDDDNSTPLNIHDSSLFNREMSRMLRQLKQQDQEDEEAEEQKMDENAKMDRQINGIKRLMNKLSTFDDMWDKGDSDESGTEDGGNVTMFMEMMKKKK